MIKVTKAFYYYQKIAGLCTCVKLGKKNQYKVVVKRDPPWTCNSVSKALCFNEN